MKIDESNFISQLKKHNEKALEYVVDQYGSLIKTIVRRHLSGLKEHQEECMNDVFLAVWDHSSSFDETKGSFQKWLAGVTKYKAIDYKRKYLNQQRETSWEEMIETGQEMRELEALEEEISLETRQLLECLREEDRELFLQLFVEELETDQVAQNTGLKKEIIYNRVSRGKKKIRKLFGNMQNGKGADCS